jgi:glucans biosynthesis protein C
MRSAPRLLFIDNIRWSMIVLVLSMHACDTYSPFGNWYYVDRQTTSFGTTLFFGAYQSFLQAFFMAVLFFIAGYFSAAAYDRKGFSQFVRDRLVRLGLPTLLYMFVIGPLTQYFLSRTWGTGGFAHQWLIHLQDGEWPGDSGGEGLSIAGFIAIMAASTFLVRMAVTEDASVLNVHPGDFPQYALMFSAGAFGYRGGWMIGLPERLCVRWASVALTLAVPLFVALIAFGGALQGQTAPYAGGFNLVSAAKCLWEALVCVGIGL